MTEKKYTYMKWFAFFFVVLTIILLTIRSNQQNIFESKNNDYMEQASNYPIVTKLPFKSAFFSVEKRYNEGDDRPILYVFSSIPFQRLQAIKLINQLEGNASSKYKIIFYDFRNPLTDGEGNE